MIGLRVENTVVKMLLVLVSRFRDEDQVSVAAIVHLLPQKDLEQPALPGGPWLPSSDHDRPRRSLAVGSRRTPGHPVSARIAELGSSGADAWWGPDAATARPAGCPGEASGCRTLSCFTMRSSCSRSICATQVSSERAAVAGGSHARLLHRARGVPATHRREGALPAPDVINCDIIHASRVSAHADGVPNRAVRLPARQHRRAGRHRRAAPAHRRGRLPVHPRADRPRRRPRGAPRGDGAPPGAGRAGRGHPAHGGRDAARRQERRHETGRLPSGSVASARRAGTAVVLSPFLW